MSPKQKLMVDAIRKRADSYYSRYSLLKDYHGDEAYHRTLTNDTHDLNKLASFLSMGHYKEALKHAESLDTVVREEIPSSVWKFLQSLDNN